MTSLNRRNEEMTKCRHRRPFFLDNHHGLTTPAIPEDEEEELFTQLNLDFHDFHPPQASHNPPLPTSPITEDEVEQLTITLNPEPPDTLPEDHLGSQPSECGPMTRSRRKKLQSKVNN